MKRDLLAIGVRDPAVLRAMEAVPRRLFVPEEERKGASENAPLPIGHGQTISAPDVVGYMTQALGVAPGAKVLDVGTGSGYQAAVLAELGCRVFSVEIVPALARSAAERLRGLGYDRVVVRAGDGSLGWPEEAPFDAIVAAAAPDRVPEPLVAQLRPGARLVLPVGPAGMVQVLRIVTKGTDGNVSHNDTLSVRFVPMTRG
jgi:protein-L-isoaspartate(D-aspartate) O-methyltransferase